MKKAEITLCPAFQRGKVDEKLFGSFVEHLGRAVYGGIYEPGHQSANTDGLRGDVMELVGELGVTAVRYPGGNFVSGFNWEDSVGPVEKRPVRMELAWGTTETNEFGLNEFVKWCRTVNVEPIIAVNLGTRGADDARRLVEYCNHPGGTYLSDLRRSHGYPEPHGIKYWCLGNEMDGNWQMGHKTAEEYGRLAEETAKLMKLTDPSIKLVLCGSSYMGSKTFGEWEYTVLNHAYEFIDYISLHQYFGNSDKDTEKFLSYTMGMAEYIEAVSAACDLVKAMKHSKHTVDLSFDEWNTWYHSNGVEFEKWSKAPHILEDVYNFEDALVVGLALITLLRHCDRVKIACIAQLVNVIAPIMTDDGGAAWRQTTFYPFMHASRFGRGTVLTTPLECGTHGNGDVPDIDCVGVLNDEKSELTVFAVNRLENEEVELCVKLSDFTSCKPIEHIIMAGFDKYADNSRDCADVVPKSEKLQAPQNGALSVKLKPFSWNVIRLSV